MLKRDFYMKSSKSKIATIFSIVCLALATMVFGVFALVSVPNQTQGTLSYIQKICYVQRTDAEDKYFSSIDKAYTYSQNGDTINIFQNATLTDDLAISKNLTLSAVQNAVTLNLQSNEISISSSASLRLGGSAYALNITSSQAPAIQNNGLLTLASGANISSISTTLQTASTSTAGIFVESGYTPSSTIQLIISGTPTNGAQVAYCQDAQDASALVDVLKLSNQSYYLYAQGNSILIAEAVVINETLQRGYSDLSSAIAESEAGNVLDVVKNVSTDTVYAIPHSLTIKTDTTAGVQVDGAFNVSAGTLTLGSGTGTLTINNYVQASGGNVNALSGSTIVGGECSLSDGSQMVVGIYNSQSGSVTVSGASVGATLSGVVGVINYTNGSVTVENGSTIGNSNGVYGIMSSGGTISVTGGQVIGGSADQMVGILLADLSVGTGASLSVSGGSINGYYGIMNGMLGGTSKVQVSGTAQILGSYAAIHNSSTAADSLVVQGGTIGSTSSTYGIYNAANASIQGGNIIAAESSGSVGIQNENGTLSITGGNISGYYGIQNGTDSGTSTGRVVVSGTTTEIYGNFVAIRNHSTLSGENGNYAVSIEGGTLETPTSAVTANDTFTALVNFDGAVSITGGTLTGYRGIQNGDGSDTSTAEVMISGANTSITGTNIGIWNVSSSAVVQIQNGTIQSGTAYGAYAINNSGDLTITGGTISGNSGIFNQGSNATVTISGTSTQITGTRYGIINQGTSENAIDVQGGTITGSSSSSYSGIDSSNGTVTVSGGSISGYYSIDMNDGGWLRLTGSPTISSIRARSSTTSFSNTTSNNFGVVIEGTFTTRDIEITESAQTDGTYLAYYENTDTALDWGYHFRLGIVSESLYLNGTSDLCLGVANVRNQTRSISYAQLADATKFAENNDILIVQRNHTTDTALVGIPLTIISNSAVTVTGNITQTASTLTLGGGSAQLSIDGAITVTSSTLNVINCYIDVPTTSVRLGAITNNQGTVTVSGSTLESPLGPAFVNNSGYMEFADSEITSMLPITNDNGELNFIDNNTIICLTSAITNTNNGILKINNSQVSAPMETIQNESGTVTISGSSTITAANDPTGDVKGIAVVNYGNGSVEITGGTITGSRAIVNGSTASTTTGTVTISQASSTYPTVINAVDNAIENYSSPTGSQYAVTISGGTIGSTSSTYGVYNDSTGEILILGGLIQSSTSADCSAIYNVSGNVTISAGEANGYYGILNADGVITVSSTASISGNYGIYNYSTLVGAVVVSGGQVTGAETDGFAGVYSDAPGGITISGGHIDGYRGVVLNNSNSMLTVSDSANIDGVESAIYNNSTRTNAVTISGGTIGNGTASYGVFNNSTGKVTVTDGDIGGSACGNAIYNNSTGNITVNGGTLTAGSSGNGIYNYGNGSVNFNGGTINASSTGIRNGHGSTSSGTITIDQTSDQTPTVILAGTGVYNGANGAHAVTINGGTIGNSNTAYGLYNASNGTVMITGGTIQCGYSMPTRMKGIFNYGDGTIVIQGGYIDGPYAIHNGNSTSNVGTITISQSSASVPTIIGSKGSTYGIYTIGGTLNVSGGTIGGATAIFASTNTSTKGIAISVSGSANVGEDYTNIAINKSANTTLDIEGSPYITGSQYSINSPYQGKITIDGLPTITGTLYVYTSSSSTPEMVQNYGLNIISYTKSVTLTLTGASTRGWIAMIPTSMQTSYSSYFRVSTGSLSFVRGDATTSALRWI